MIARRYFQFNTDHDPFMLAEDFNSESDRSHELSKKTNFSVGVICEVS